MHKSQLGRGEKSPFGKVIIDENHVEAQGRSVMNKYSTTFKSPFKEQLELDSKDLIVELLERND